VIACAIVAALCATAPRAHAAERLCDPSFENCRNQVLSLIDSELMGIDVAFWFMEDSRYATHIINRWKAGVPVRLIIDPRANPSYPLNASMLSMFQQAGIPMVKKTSGGIMHWKTMVFAGQSTVEFGSANYSDNAFVPVAPYTNYVSETVYYTDDAALVNSFKTKFDNLWTDTTNYSAYANVTSRVRVYPTFTISADLNFPPGPSYAGRLIALEKAETQKIDVNMYRITQQAHSDAIIAAFRRGVPIRYLGETREYRDTNRIWVSWNMDRMYAAGVPMKVRLHDGENHEKVVLLYGQGLTVFGSSNWTSASDNSQQEHNYFTTKTWIFQWFEDQFDRMWNNTNPDGAIESTLFVPGPPDTPSYRSIANGATGVPTTGQRLVWYGGPWAHLYDIYFGTDSSASTPVAANQPLGPSDTTSKTQSFALPSLQSGATYYWKIVSKTAAMVSRTGPVWSFTTSGSSSGGQLPAPWLDRDIGSVGAAGSAQFANGTFTVNASGADIWGTADAFNFVYQPWSGDGSIVARVASVTNASAWSKAGVMFRTSLDAGSAHAFMLVSAANGVSFQRRATTSGTSVSTTVAGVTPPRWVRLDRSGNTFTASYSSDGTSWTLVATDTITMPQDLFVGMAVTSHNNTTLTTATLDSVTASQGADTDGQPATWPVRVKRSVAMAGIRECRHDGIAVKGLDREP